MEDPEKARKRQKRVAKRALKLARKLQAKADKAAKQKAKHKHNDLGKTHTEHRRGKLYLVTKCTCGKVVARDKLEK